MRTFHTLGYWRERYPHVKALILISPAGSSFILPKGQTIQGRFSLLGIIE